MAVTSTIPVERIAKSRISTIDFNNLEFGKYIADHMIVADFKDGKWHEPTIIPYGDMMMSPAMLSLHYGQAIFEGMKAGYQRFQLFLHLVDRLPLVGNQRRQFLNHLRLMRGNGFEINQSVFGFVSHAVFYAAFGQ